MDESQPPDSYLTLANEGEAKQKIKGSTFLAFAVPVKSEEEAQQKLLEVRKKFHDSTHVGSAWRIAPPPDGLERYDDDGEPHGTTGPPILQAITGNDLWNVACYVVRYYGGTKLGTGGLIRAYGGAASEAITSTKTKEVVIKSKIRIEVSNQQAGAIYNLADKSGAKVYPPEYTAEGLILTLSIRASRAESIPPQVTELTAGRAKVEILQ